jgi:hypothetical protein
VPLRSANSPQPDVSARPPAAGCADLVSQPSPLLPGRENPPGQRLVRSLRRRPRLRAGLVQLAYVAGAVGAAVLAAGIETGPEVDAARTSNLLFAVGGGIISLVAVVFSLLFLTVQFASTALSPRLNLFRDEPLVWHAFGLFVGVFVFATTAHEFATEATTPIPEGKHQVRMEFAYDGGGLAKGGDVTLYYDGTAVGSGRVGATEPMISLPMKRPTSATNPAPQSHPTIGRAAAASPGRSIGCRSTSATTTTTTSSTPTNACASPWPGSSPEPSWTAMARGYLS